MARVPSRHRLARSGLVALCATLVLAASLYGPGGAARAQGWGFFGGIFGGQPQQVQPPPADRPLYRPRRRAVAPQPRVSTPTRQAESQPKPPAPDASRFVLVIGDSLAQLLAGGLDEALADRADVGVLHKARDSSGLVRADFYDWPRAVTEILADQDKKTTPAANKTAPDKPSADAKPPLKTQHIDVAVIMIGSNDRQSLSEDGKTFSPDSDEWTAAYTRRALAVADAFKKKNIPLVWVGIPITKSDSFADDMAAFNEIYRDVAEKTGATFVDTWEAFSDGNGDFNAFGPDINGQTVRLRSADGVHFTKAGSRKLAHFVEGPIRRDLDQHKQPEAQTASLSTDAPVKPPGVGLPSVKPDAGPVKSLNEPPVAPGGRLGSAARDLDRRDPLIDATLVKGEPQAPSPGRADDASWPPR